MLAQADEDLMVLAREGDAQAFEVVFDRHADVAFSLAYRMCGRRQLAEDVVQEAFLSVWRNAGTYDRVRGSVRTWILGVVRNRAIDAFRRDAVRVSRDVSDEGIADKIASRELTDVAVERRDEARSVGAALNELPADQREVIELAYYGGFSHSEIADVLSLPPGTVKGRMRLGLAKMRVALGDSVGATL
jgi:RNA polymerase sigma-70 factor (ECF subfamily)